MHHLCLRGVPKIVVRLRSLKLLERVQHFSLVAVVLGDRFARPVIGTARVVIIRLVAHKVHTQLAPGDDFIEVTVARPRKAPVLLHGFIQCERNREWPNVPEMKIRAEPAGRFALRMVAVIRVLAELLGDELPQPPRRLFASALPRLDRGNASVEFLPSLRHVRAHIIFHQAFRHAPAFFRGSVFKRLQKLRHQARNAWPHNRTRILRLQEQLRRHDHICVHRPERYLQLLSQPHTPAFRHAHGIFIANDHCSFHIREEPLVILMRRAPHNEANAAFRAVFFNVRQTFVEKVIVP